MNTIELVAHGKFDTANKKAFLKAMGHSALASVANLLNTRIEIEKAGRNPDEPRIPAHPEGMGTQATEERPRGEKEALQDRFSAFDRPSTNMELIEAYHTIYRAIPAYIADCGEVNQYDELMELPMLLSYMATNDGTGDITEDMVVDAMQRAMTNDPRKVIGVLREEAENNANNRKANMEEIKQRATGLTYLVEPDGSPALNEAFKVIGVTAQHRLLMAAVSNVLRPSRKDGKGGGLIARLQLACEKRRSTVLPVLLRLAIADTADLVNAADKFAKAHDTELRTGQSFRTLSRFEETSLRMLTDNMHQEPNRTEIREALKTNVVPITPQAQAPSNAPTSAPALNFQQMIQSAIQAQIAQAISQAMAGMFAPAPAPAPVVQAAPPAPAPAPTLDAETLRSIYA